MPSTLARWKMRAQQLQAEVYAFYLAFHDPRTRRGMPRPLPLASSVTRSVRSI
jgi:hypothetical protein